MANSAKYGVPSRPEVRIPLENRYFKAQGGMCSICGQPLLKEARLRQDAPGWSFDHVYPRSRYGLRFMHRGNLLLAHIGCNTRKKSKEPTGCEILLLHGVNARLGFELTERTKVAHETAMQIAWKKHCQLRAEMARA